MHLQRVPVPKSSVENTLRPELTSLATLSHVMHLNMLACVPQLILAGADLSKGKPGGWKSHVCALIFQCSQLLYSQQHAENCCLLYLPQNTYFFLPLIHLPSSPLSLLGRMELTTRAPISTHKGSVMSIPPEHFTHKGSVLSIPPDHFSNHPLYLERHKRIFWGN